MAIFPLPRRRKDLQRDAPGRKSKSLEANRDGTVRADGVFVSARTLASRPVSPPCSSHSLDGSETSSSSTGMMDHSNSSSNSSSAACASPPTSWKSAGTTTHNLNAPLVVSDPDEGSRDFIVDEAERLGKIIARSRRLPGTWYYSSNHVLVNQERARRTMAPLVRMAELDLLARWHAQTMADERDLRHVAPDALRHALDHKRIRYRRLGENVARGASVRAIHDDMMNTLANKNNIVDRRYTHFGMGTAVDENGELYLCQLFRG